MKKIVGFCLLIVSVLLSVSCTFAASGFGGGSRGDGWGSGGFSTGTTSTEVSYDALSSLALELNDRLASGEFGDVLKEVSCNIGVYSTVSGRDKYAIFYHYQASNYWYCNASGGLVYAYKDIDRISDLLGGNNGGIAYFLNRMEYVLTGSLLTAVNSINTATNSLLTTCNTISAKLDTLTSVISNGKVLVDNSDVVSALYTDFASVMGILESVDTGSLDPTAKFPALTGLIAVSTRTYELVYRIGFGIDDVVSAIQSIPAFDDTELLSGLSALGATDTRIADAIDYNFGQYSGTHTFPSLDKRQFYVYGDKAELFEDISGQVLYSSSERLSTFSYTRDYDGMTRTLYVRALPTCAQYSLELLSDTRPTAPITISKIEYRTLLGGVRYRDSIVYPVAWRYSSVANKYYAVTGFTVYYKDDPEQYPVSTSASAFENPYVYGFDSKPVDVVFSSRFTAFQQLENTRLINALSGRDYTSQLTAVAEKLDALANKPAVDLTTIESTLSTISDKLDNTASDVNNTIINITKDNDYFSVFYITDGDGNTRSVTDFAGALTGASGKLLSLLYRLVFADALGSVDGDLGNMEDFFTSEEPPPATAAMNGDTAPANEVIDVWAS